MDRVRKYRFLKKVQKILNAPVRPEETYTTSVNSAYIGTSSSANRSTSSTNDWIGRSLNADNGSNPNLTLRRSQVGELARMLLKLIAAIERRQRILGILTQVMPLPLPSLSPRLAPLVPPPSFRASIATASETDSEKTRIGSISCSEITQTESVTEDEAVIHDLFASISITLSELTHSILYTEPEKRARRVASLTPTIAPARSLPEAQGSSARIDREEFALMRNRVISWQRELGARTRKLSSISITVRDLGVNINDMRCSQLLRERNEAEARMEVTVEGGVKMFAEMEKTLRAAVGWA